MKTKADRVTPEERNLALLHDEARKKYERRGIVAGAKIGFRTQQAAIAAKKKGKPVDEAIRRVLADAIPLMTEAMVHGHLVGMKISKLSANVRKLPLAMATTPYDAAIKLLRKRLNISIEQLNALRSLYGAEAVKVLSRASDAVTDSISDHWDKIKSGLDEKIVEGRITEAAARAEHVNGGIQAVRDGFEAAGLVPDNSYTFENLFRTQIQMAYGAGRWQQDQAPEIQEILWGYKYCTVGDDRVRPEHAALDGTTAEKDDPLWRTMWPPHGYSCRCTTISIFEERKSIYPPAVVEVDGKTVIPGPDPGFQYNPGELAAELMQAGTT